MQIHPTFYATFNVRVEWNFRRNFGFWMKPDILICTISSTMFYPTFYSSKVQKFIHSIIKNGGHNHSNTFSVGWIDGFWWQKSSQRKLRKWMQSLFFFCIWILSFFPFQLLSVKLFKVWTILLGHCHSNYHSPCLLLLSYLVCDLLFLLIFVARHRLLTFEY